MTIIVRDGTNTPRTITAIQVRDGTNTPRDIEQMWVRDSNAVSRLVFSTGSPLSVSCDPTIVGGVSEGTGIVTTTGSTATPAGGIAPYTYLWTLTYHSNVTPPTIGTPTAALTNFTQTGVVSEDGAVFRCTVTDAALATATADVSAYFINDIGP